MAIAAAQRLRPAAVLVAGNVKVAMHAWQAGTPVSRPRCVAIGPDGGFVLANSLTNEVTLVKVVK